MCITCDKIDAELQQAYTAVAAGDMLVEKALGLRELTSIARSELRLRNYVEGIWDIHKTEAIKTAISMAKRLESDKKIASAIEKIMNKWATAILPVYNMEMSRVYRLARIAGHKKATRQTTASLQFNVHKMERKGVVTKVESKIKPMPSFDLVDDKAIEALEDKNIFWVGNHYDVNVSDSVRDVARTVMVEAGGSSMLAGQLIKERLEKVLGIFTTPSGYTGSQKQYFEGLVANAMTVGRVYGQMRSFSQIGITKYTIVNPGGDRICEACLSIQGQTFEIKDGLNQIAKEFDAKNPEDIKNIHPWVAASQISGLSSDQLAANGLSLPPYHYLCRCTVDVSTEIESYEELAPIEFPIPPKQHKH
jgi:DNA-binding HxlR family transcriptional regulator